jgi:hypothetical protein
VLTGLLGAAQAGAHIGSRLHLGAGLAVTLLAIGTFAVLAAPLVALDEAPALAVVLKRAAGGALLLGIAIPALVVARWKGAPPQLAARALGLGMGGAAAFASVAHGIDWRLGGLPGLRLAGVLAIVAIAAISMAAPFDRGLVVPGVMACTLLAVAAWDVRDTGTADGSWFMAALAAAALLSAGIGGITHGVDAAEAADRRVG